MSERDNDTGQFTPAEPLDGPSWAFEADVGYTPMDEPQDDHPEAEIRLANGSGDACRKPRAG